MASGFRSSCVGSIVVVFMATIVIPPALALGAPADAVKPKSVWYSPQLTLTIEQRHGDTFTGRAVTSGAVREMTGSVKDNKLSWLAKDVHAVHGSPGSDNFGTIIADHIDFTYPNSNGTTGSYSLVLEDGRFLGGSAIFVALNGNDKNPGTPSQPIESLGKALAEAKPGDVICLDDGEYHGNAMFKKSGTADGWITLRPTLMTNVQTQPPHVKIVPKENAMAIDLAGHSYLRIEGLEISGGYFGIGSSGHLGNHTIVQDCLVHDTDASGIQLNDGDYRTIVGNVVHDCAKKWKGDGSGISIYTPTSVDDAPGFHNVIAGNISHDNSNPAGGTDGNGIIFDDGNHKQHDKHPYTPASLIENNLAYLNGGAGIQVYLSTHVTVRNNTAYWNHQLAGKFTWRGELSCVSSDDCVWINNIGWANPSLNPHNTAMLEQSCGKNVIWINNISFNGTQGQSSLDFAHGHPDGNLLGRDPLLANPPTDFRLKPGSPALGAATAAHGVPDTDLAGILRSKPANIGAY